MISTTLILSGKHLCFQINREKQSMGDPLASQLPQKAWVPSFVISVRVQGLSRVEVSF